MGKNKDVLVEEPADTLQEHPIKPTGYSTPPLGTTQYVKSRHKLHQHSEEEDITYTEQGFIYTGLVTTV